MDAAQRGDQFYVDVSNRLPVETLRLKYSAKDVAALVENGLINPHWIFDKMLDWPADKKTPPEWSKAFFVWFLDAAQCHAEYIQLTWGYSFQTLQEAERLGLTVREFGHVKNYVRFECSLVDWTCIISKTLPAAPWILDYLIRKGYTGRRGFGWCLAFSLSPSQQRDAISKRLLDAGAGVEWLFEMPGTELAETRLEANARVREWHASRQRCRQQCWALLGSWRHGAILKQWMPREVAQMIARALWERRWDQ